MLWWPLVAGQDPVVVFFITLAIAWAISPGGFFLVSIVLESRIPPVSWRKQFLSFFPGDFFLGASFATLVAIETTVTDSIWVTGWWWLFNPLLVFVVCFGVGFALHKMDAQAYPHKALQSPTKIYHDFGLYWLYATAIVSTFLVDVVSSSWYLVPISIVVLAPWLLALLFEDRIPYPGYNKTRAQYAHVTYWTPLWKARKEHVLD